jgi:hypothetical protein
MSCVQMTNYKSGCGKPTELVSLGNEDVFLCFPKPQLTDLVALAKCDWPRLADAQIEALHNARQRPKKKLGDMTTKEIEALHNAPPRQYGDLRDLAAFDP